MRTSQSHNTPTTQPDLTPNAARLLQHQLSEAESFVRETAQTLTEYGTKRYQGVHEHTRVYNLVAAKAILELASLARPAFKELADELGVLTNTVDKLKASEEEAFPPNPYNDMLAPNPKGEAAYFRELKTLGKALDRIAAHIEKISSSLNTKGADVQMSAFIPRDESQDFESATFHDGCGRDDDDFAWGGGRDWTPSSDEQTY